LRKTNICGKIAKALSPSAKKKVYNKKVKYWELHHLLRQIEYSTDTINRYNILTTTGCNARCFYCFEEGVEIKTMSSRTAEQVAT
jgi:sulfatase maturation enzyme AslB (radical SAM superfamily)